MGRHPLQADSPPLPGSAAFMTTATKTTFIGNLPCTHEMRITMSRVRAGDMADFDFEPHPQQTTPTVRAVHRETGRVLPVISETRDGAKAAMKRYAAEWLAEFERRPA